MIVEAEGFDSLRGSLHLTPAIKIHRTGVVEMSFPSGARAAVGLPSVPPQRLIRNDCSSRDTRSRGCIANLRHIAKGGSSARFRAHKIVHTQLLRSARDRGYRPTTPITPEDRLKTPKIPIQKTAEGRRDATGAWELRGHADLRRSVDGWMR